MYNSLLINRIKNIKGNRVLVAPLNWGLGHATRCVPVIKLLLAENREVVIASEGYPLQFLKEEFPNLQTVEFSGLKVKYSKGNSQVLAMMMHIPQFVYHIVKEHFILKKTINIYNINTVISDNRFGLWHKSVKSIYITHQIGVKIGKNMRILNKIAYLLHKFIINRYSECWIPDFEDGNNLSGDLSHKYPLPENTFFVGILSRFSNEQPTVKTQQNYKNVAVISGVEPHRTILQKKLLKLFLNSGGKCLIIAGKPAERINIENISNVTIISHLSDEEFAQTLQNAENIYCRSGYSTLMDLYALGIKSAILIPTPGQTEQQYLAEHFKNKGFIILKQNEI